MWVHALLPFYTSHLGQNAFAAIPLVITNMLLAICVYRLQELIQGLTFVNLFFSIEHVSAYY